MIGMEEARRLVDRRLNRLSMDEHGTVAFEDAMLLCPGSDVNGPDLTRELAMATVDAMELMATATCECPDSVPATFNCASPPIIAGMLNRIFWLGFELGRENGVGERAQDYE